MCALEFLELGKCVRAGLTDKHDSVQREWGSMSRQ